jgi:hypothetical protein
MCFSAGASFGAGVLLAGASIASLKKVEKPSQLMFAFVPIIFSIQQLTEGLVWVALNHHSSWKNIPAYIFLFIAQLVWPIWVPLSVLLLEKNENHKKALITFLFLGFSLALYLGYCLLFYKVDAHIIPYHIHYDLYFPQKYNSIVGGVYFLATIIPPFLSTQRRMAILGSFNLLSFIITELFFDDYLISVWCFFSALISWRVFLVMRDLQEDYHRELNTAVQ